MTVAVTGDLTGPVYALTGTGYTLNYTSSGATSGTLDGTPLATLPDGGLSGFTAAGPGSTALHTLILNGPGGSFTDTWLVTSVNSASTSSLTSDKFTVAQGDTYTLETFVPTHSSSVRTLDGVSIAAGTTLTLKTANAQGTFTHTLTVTPYIGAQIVRTVQVTVGPPTPGDDTLGPATVSLWFSDAQGNDVLQAAPGSTIYANFGESFANEYQWDPNTPGVFVPLAFNDRVKVQVPVVMPASTRTWTFRARGPGNPDGGLTWSQRSVTITATGTPVNPTRRAPTAPYYTVGPWAVGEIPTNDVPTHGGAVTIDSNTTLGAWSDLASWLPATGGPRIPQAGDHVRIKAGHTILMDTMVDETIDTVNIFGTFRALTDRSTRLTVRNLVVHNGGYLELGTASAPVQAKYNCSIVFATWAGPHAMDPGDTGGALFVVPGAKFVSHGAFKAPFVRLAAPAMATQTSITLASAPTGWRIGDRIFLPDSRLPQAGGGMGAVPPEVVLITNIVGNVVTFFPALTYDHPGSSAGPAGPHNEYLPHVANLHRNVSIRSKDHTQVDRRAFVYFGGTADVDCRYAGFHATGRFRWNGSIVDADIGTLDRIDHCPVNFVYLSGPPAGRADGYTYSFVGNSVFDVIGTKGNDSDSEVLWGISVLASSYGLVKDNVSVNWLGACLALPTGEEYRNVVEGNFCAWTRGAGGRTNNGHDGMCIWTRSGLNYIRNNVACNARPLDGGSIYVYCMGITQDKLQTGGVNFVRIPASKTVSTYFESDVILIDIYTYPLEQFEGNEIYGAIRGYSFWWLGTEGSEGPAGPAGTMKNLVAWNIGFNTIFFYETQDLTLDGFILRNYDVATGQRGQGATYGDYYTGNFTGKNWDIRGTETAVDLPANGWGFCKYENCNFAQNFTDFYWTVPFASRGPYVFGECVCDLINCTFSGISIVDVDDTYAQTGSNPVVRRYFRVFGRNGDPAVRWRLYAPDQEPAEICPPMRGGFAAGEPYTSAYYKGDVAEGWNAGHTLTTPPDRTNQATWNAQQVANHGDVTPANAVVVPGGWWSGKGVPIP
jgi:hypothetical protein